jgi:hypothetical protein
VYYGLFFLPLLLGAPFIGGKSARTVHDKIISFRRGQKIPISLLLRRRKKAQKTWTAKKLPHETENFTAIQHDLLYNR